MFDVTYTYKVSIFPFPMIFITALAKFSNGCFSKAIQIIISKVTSLVDRAHAAYNAELISVEPNPKTHNFNFNGSKNVVAVCTAIRFRNLDNMHSFIEKEIKHK